MTLISQQVQLISTELIQINVLLFLTTEFHRNVATVNKVTFTLQVLMPSFDLLTISLFMASLHLLVKFICLQGQCALINMRKHKCARTHTTHLHIDRGISDLSAYEGDTNA